MGSWKVIVAEALTPELIRGLLEDEIAFVRVPGFVSTSNCDKALQGIKSHGMAYYANVQPPIGRIGITQNEHKGGQAAKQDYFAKVARMEAMRRGILANSGDVVDQVIGAVQSIWKGGADLAFEESEGHHYFAGVIRVIGRGLLHFDWAPYDANGWAIAAISAQLTWNVFLQQGSGGGSTRVYHRQWQPSDEKYRVSSTYAFNEAVVEGADRVEILSERGELALFNPRNYHEILASDGSTERITISSFLGLLNPPGTLVFWS